MLEFNVCGQSLFNAFILYNGRFKFQLLVHCFLFYNFKVFFKDSKSSNVWTIAHRFSILKYSWVLHLDREHNVDLRQVRDITPNGKSDWGSNVLWQINRGRLYWIMTLRWWPVCCGLITCSPVSMNFGFRGRIADLVRQDPAASSKNRKSCCDRKHFLFHHHHKHGS